jgi:hypothetical protein
MHLLWLTFGQTLRTPCATRETRNRTKKIKNKSFAIPAAAKAIPPKPKTAATIVYLRTHAPMFLMQVAGHNLSSCVNCSSKELNPPERQKLQARTEKQAEKERWAKMERWR